MKEVYFASAGIPGLYYDSVAFTIVYDTSLNGLVLKERSGDPASTEDGQVWYAGDKFRCQENGVVGDLRSASGGAPSTADYLVKTADAGLSAERVVTDTTSITWDWATGGQAKAKRAALTGDVTASADSNATTIANDAVTYAKMQNVSAASRILGRGSASGAGDPEELSLSGGLSLSGTTLSAPTVSGTDTYVAYFTAPTTLGGDAGLTYDATNDVLYPLYAGFGNMGYGNVWANSSFSAGASGTTATDVQDYVTVTSDGAAHPHIALRSYGSSAYTPGLQGIRYGGTLASPSAVTSGMGLLSIAGRGRDDSGLYGISALLQIVAAENFANSGDHHGAYFTFETLGVAQSWPRTERFKVGPGASPATKTTGSADFTAVSAPGTPASGIGSFYVDSTSKNMALKNDAGTINHGVQTKASASTKFLTAIADDGTVSNGQPAFSDLSGTLASAQFPHGTSNPGSPSTNDIYFRTDLGYLIYYDGTRWLTFEEFALTASMAGTMGSTTAGALLQYFTLPVDYVAWLTKCQLNIRVRTTNNGTNFWNVRLEGIKQDQTSAGTVFNVSTSGDTADRFTAHDQTINAAPPSNSVILMLSNQAKTLSPGGIDIIGTVYCRKIIT